MVKENKRTFLIMGLGFFGSTAAKYLMKYGQDVIALDCDMKKVEHIADEVTQAVCCDFTDPDQLSSVGIDAVDVAVIATGDDLQASILAILNLKDLNVPKIVAKANDIVARKVLKKIGADQVITPEADTAKTIAKKLAFKHVVDLFDIDGAYSVMEIYIFKKWVGRSLIELNLRNTYELNVIGIRRNGKLTVAINPNDPLRVEDQLLVVGPENLYDRLKETA